ncbi:MAG: hypothetical protein M0Z85_09810 [Gammaproteobacteria bacterium]|nr:hypothetical protein [Gammaproteobacteria bacterium]
MLRPFLRHAQTTVFVVLLMKVGGFWHHQPTSWRHLIHQIAGEADEAGRRRQETEEIHEQVGSARRPAWGAA